MDAKELNAEQLEDVAGGLAVGPEDLTDITIDIRNRPWNILSQEERRRLAGGGVEIPDDLLVSIAGGVLERDLALDWMEEVAYARLKTTLSLDQVLASLSEAEGAFSAEDYAELQSIARNIYTATPENLVAMFRNFGA